MPGTLQLVQVTRAPTRVQSLLIKNEEVMLVNPDIANNIYIGNDPSSQLISVPALGSVTLDTKDHDLWVSTSGGNYTVNAYLMPNGSNWVPSPAQVAAQINALGLATANNQATQIANDGSVISNTSTTAANVANLTTGGNPGGVPVLRGTDNLGNATAATIASGATSTLLSSVSVTKPGFEAVFKLNLPAAAGTIPFAALVVAWQDSNTGLQVGIKTYILPCGNGPANAISVYLSGPCRGNQITLTLKNYEPANALTVTWAFNQTSHEYAADKFLQPVYLAGAAPIGFSNPAGNPSKGLLAQSISTVVATGTSSRLVAASNAKIAAMLDNTGQPNAAILGLTTPTTAGLYDEQTPPSPLFKLNAAAGAVAAGEWQMPNGPVVMQVTNTGATGSITPSVAILIKES